MLLRERLLRAGQRLEPWDVWIVFGLAFLVRILFNFGRLHPETCLFSCDGSEYLRNAQALYLLFQKGLPLQSLINLKLAGPIFPLYILSSCMLFGQAPSYSHFVPLLLSQSMLSAITCVFVASIGRLCWDRKTGLLAAGISIIYPAFVINSGRLYSETFALFLLSALLYLCCRIFSGTRLLMLTCFLTGITAAALQLTRSIMVIISVATLLFLIVSALKTAGAKPAIKAATSFLLGFVLVLGSWMCFSSRAFNGSANLVPDRASHYNFFIGNNVDSLGWLSIPYPDMKQMDNKNFLQLASQSFRSSPRRWCLLLLDKSIRLFKAPWNDFRTSMGPITYHMQVLFHQSLLMLATVGIGLALLTRKSPGDNLDYSKQLICRVLLFTVLSLHAIYLLFITVPRYNLTAMPILIMLAAAGLLKFAELLRNEKTCRPAVFLISAGTALFLISYISLPDVDHVLGLSKAVFALVILSMFKLAAVTSYFWLLWSLSINTSTFNTKLEKYCLTAIILLLGLTSALTLAVPARANGRILEWQASLSNSRNIMSVVFRLSPLNVNGFSETSYLLVDSSGVKQLRNADLRIEGRRISGPFIPGLSMLGDLNSFKSLDAQQIYLDCGYIFNCLSTPAEISPLDLRQWFLLPLPQDLVDSAHKKGFLQVELSTSAKKGFTAFGQYVWDKSVLLPDLSRCSWEKAFYGVENTKSFSDPRYDIKLVSPQLISNSVPDVLLLTSLRSNIISSSVAPLQLERAERQSLVANVNQFPSYNQQDFWIVRLSGTVNSAMQISTPKTARLAVETTVQSEHTGSQLPVNLPPRQSEWAQQTGIGSAITGPLTLGYNPPWIPHNLKLHHMSTDFDFAFPLIPSAMPGHLKSIQLHLGPVPPNSPKLTGNCKIEIYKSMGNPLSCKSRLQLPYKYSIYTVARNG